MKGLAHFFHEEAQNINFQQGTVIKGAVFEISDDFVKVHVGLKSEGRIDRSEFLDKDGNLTVQEGEIVEVALHAVENGYGETKLSHQLVKKIRAWQELEKAYEEKLTVSGVITSAIKGGYLVGLGEVRAFMPGSLIDLRPVFDPTDFIDKEVEFKIIKLDPIRKNVVVSRRDVLREAFSDMDAGPLTRYKAGTTVTGRIKSLMDYGAFVDLGEIDGLLHNSDISWQRITKPSSVLEINQEVQVLILNVDVDNMRISLGMKQLQEDPWVSAQEKYAEGTRHVGKVTALPQKPFPYGAFVSLEEGIEGLVHISQMDWVTRHLNPSDILTIGQEVEVQVLEINNENRRLSLGMKQCMDNPWTVFAENNKVGDKIQVTIRSITDLGIFASIGDRIDGLVHETDLSWDQQPSEAKQKYEVGEEIDVAVLSIDQGKERVGLGIKQLTEDSFSSFIEKNKVKDKVSGVVCEIEPQFVIIDLGDEVKGRLSAKEASAEYVSDMSNLFSMGQEVNTEIIRLDHRSRRVQLSIKSVERNIQRKAMREQRVEMDKSSRVTLGDLLKDDNKT